MKAKKNSRVRRTSDDASLFFEILKTTPEETKKFVRRAMAIAFRIDAFLNDKGMTQKDLAEKMGKKEPEISKWLAGTQNFTIETLAAIEVALDDEIILIPGDPFKSKG